MAVKKNDSVAIPEFKTTKMLVPIVGVSPLLCNRITQEVLETLSGGKKEGEKKSKDNRGWKEIAMDGAYRHPKTGAYVFPSSGLMNALASASYRMGLTKSAVEVFANVQIEDEWLDILGPAPRARQDSGRNQGKGLVAVNRAEFPLGWHINVPVQFTSEMSAKKLGMLFEAAGFGVGIGCWRPEKKGRCGRFVIQRSAGSDL
jgi:hypothetical protein